MAASFGHLERLFESYHARVWAYAARRVGRDDAYDVTSETFLIAFRRIEEMPRDELPWLLAIARRVCANEMRSTRRRAALVATLQASSTRTAQQQESDIVVDAIALGQAFNSLAPRDQEVLMLTSWDGLTLRQAAKVLGCSSAAFGVRLHRARRKLTQTVEDHEGSRSKTDPLARSSAGRSPA